MKHFTEFMNENVRHEYSEFGGHRLCYPLELMDGTTLSIQASGTHYCDPRQTTEVANYAWYEEFEIGFPSKVIEEILPYAEEDESPTDTVYGYVPKSLIEDFIKARGGVYRSVTEEK